MDEHLKEWLASGGHLPDCLKDFHNQKDLFRRVDELASNRKWIGPTKPDWVSAQIYTIDCFLWFMAAHGYTLQKVRSPIKTRPPFCDLGATMNDWQSRQIEHFRQFVEANRMAQTIQEHDQITLTVDLPEHDLKQGDRGTVVHIHKQGAGYTVEFIGDDDRTKAVITLLASQVHSITENEES